MEYMESMMQDQIDGAIALQNAICDDALDIYKQTKIMPLDMKMQRDDLLDALKDALCSLEISRQSDYVTSKVRDAIEKATGVRP